MNATLDNITGDKQSLVDLLTQAGAEFKGDKCRCIFHNDTHASSHIYEEGGHWRFKCFVPACGVSGDYLDIKERLTGRTAGEIIAEFSDPRKDTRQAAKSTRGTHTKPQQQPRSLEDIKAGIEGDIEAQYAYQNAAGKLAGVIIRYRTGTEKSFRPVIPAGNGLFIIGAMQAPRPLYNLPAVMEADSVVIVEGEKCVDALTRYGIAATTSAGGANAAKQTDWKPLAGKQVVLWPDFDPAGIKYIQDVKRQLAGLDCELSQINPAELDLEVKEDAADFIAQLKKAYGQNKEAIKADIVKAIRAAKPTNEWPQIIPLEGCELPDINLDHLPDGLRWLAEFCKETERTLGTPAGVAFLLALSAIGTAAQDKFKVGFTLRPDYEEVLGLFVMGIMATGERKTGLVDLIFEPLKIYERDFNDRHKAVILENQRIKRILEGKINRLEQELIKGKDVDPAELDRLTRELADFVEMQNKQIFSKDVTAENIAYMLERNRTHINFSTEGELLQNLFGRYSQSKGDMKIEAVLDAYAGTHLRINRVNKPTIDIPEPRLSIAILTQRATFDNMPKQDYLIEKGFLGRFIYYLPEKEPLPETFIEEAFNESLQRHYTYIINSIFNLDIKGQILKASPEAENVYADFYEGISRRKMPDGDLYPLLSWANKIRGNTARIIGILHIAQLKDHTDQIDKATIQAGIDIAEILIAHAKAIFASIAETPETHLAKRIRKWITRHGKPDFSKTDLWQAMKTSKLDTAELLEKPLEILINRGYILPMPDGKTGKGRKAERYRISPEIKKRY